MKKKKFFPFIIIFILAVGLIISFPWLALNVFGENISGEVDSIERKEDHVFQGSSARNDKRTVAKSIITIKYSFYTNDKFYKGWHNYEYCYSCITKKHIQLQTGTKIRVRFCRFLPSISAIECAEE